MLELTQALGRAAASFSANPANLQADAAGANADEYLAAVPSQVGSFLTSTYDNATYNQMFNEGTFVRDELTEKQKLSGAAARKASNLVRFLRQEEAAADVHAGWCRVITAIVQLAVLCAALGVVLGGLGVSGESLRGLYALVAVGFFIGLSILMRRALRRRHDAWRKYRWSMAAGKDGDASRHPA